MKIAESPRLERVGESLVGETPRGTEWLLMQVVVGVFFIALFVVFGVGFAVHLFPSSWSTPIATVIAVPSCVAALYLALWHLAGRRLVIVERGVLRVRHHIGLFAIPTGIAFKPSRVQSLRVRGTPARDDPWGRKAAFRLEVVLGARWYRSEPEVAFPLAEDDRAGWLVEWGEAIAEEMALPFTIARSARFAMKPECDDGVVRPNPAAEYPPPPVAVPVVIESAPERVHVTISADRVRRQSASIQNFVGLALAALGAYIVLKGIPPSGVGLGRFGADAGCLTLAMIGAAVFRHGILNHRERWEIEIVPSVCEIRRIRGGRERSYRLRPSQIRDVRIGHTQYSNVHGSDSEPRDELQIVPREGPWVRLMEGWSDRSMRWVASVLRTALVIERGAGPRDGW